MNKVFLTVIATILGIVTAAKIGLFNALFMFFLVGIVPGTDIIIPANVMLLMISTTICSILFFPTAREILRIILIRHFAQQNTGTKAHLPKRRFSEI
jgi:hypothetical protein